MQKLNQFLSTNNRYKSIFSILLIDADHFKLVNDNFGHGQGDILLQTLASRLQSSVRESDIVCRLGGNEFLAICPHTNKDGALKLGAKVLSQATPLCLETGTEYWNGSLSIGLSQVSDKIKTIAQLLNAADQALYHSKHKGGFCIS